MTPDHPEPLVRARPCPAELLPSGAARMIRKATEAGLPVRGTLAIGWVRPRPNKPLGGVVKSVLVKIKQGDTHLIGIWEDGKFRRGYRWPGHLGLPDRLGARALEAEIGAP